MDWCNETVASALNKAVRRDPNAEALVQNKRRVTYKELTDRASMLAAGISQLGITRGQHIGVLHPNDIIVQTIHYASACLGTVYVPINIMFNPQDLSYILRHSDVSILFVGGKYRDRSLAEIVLETIPELKQMKGSEFVLSNYPKLKWIIQTDSDPLVTGFIRLDDIEKAGAMQPLPFVNMEVKPEDISHLAYTSGSTAFPKGVLLTHRGMVGCSFYKGKALRVGSSDRFLVPSPFYHTGGLTSTMSILFEGGRLYITERFDPKEVMEIVHKERITVMNLWNTMMVRVLEHPERSQYDLSSWQKTVSPSGESYDRKKEAGISHIVGFYSLTEGSNPVSLVMPEEKRHTIRRNSNGLPLPGVEIKIVDPDTEKDLPPMVSGEIRFRGWNRFVGYYKPGIDEIPEKVFDKDGFFRTGDCGYLDNEGYLYLTGRYKDMIKTGGENVSCKEVQDFLCKEIPSVVMAHVVGVPDEQWGEAVTAFIEAKPGTDYTPQDIIKICKEKLTGFKVPKHVFFVKSGDWPVVSGIKIEKNELRKRAIQHLLANKSDIIAK